MYSTLPDTLKSTRRAFRCLEKCVKNYVRQLISSVREIPSPSRSARTQATHLDFHGYWKAESTKPFARQPEFHLRPSPRGHLRVAKEEKRVWLRNVGEPSRVGNKIRRLRWRTAKQLATALNHRGGRQNTSEYYPFSPSPHRLAKIALGVVGVSRGYSINFRFVRTGRATWVFDVLREAF